MSNFHAMLEETGGSFRNSARLPVNLRLADLRRLADTLAKEQDRIVQAIHADLGKRRSEILDDELLPLRNNIRDLVRSLPRLARPRRRAGFFAGSERIMPGPYGLVLIRGYWSDPVRSALEPLAAALAAGNRVVLRPAQQTPVSAQLLTEILEPLFPDGEVIVADREVADRELKAEHFDLIVGTGALADTGSTPFVSIPLGKNPVIVDASANIRRAARRIVRAKFRNAGQSPDAPDCVLAHAGIRERLTYEMHREIRVRLSGDQEQSAEPFRVLNDERFDALRKLLDRGRLVDGGEFDRARRYIAPTVLVGISPADPIMREVIAGPLLPVLDFQTLNEVAEIANGFGAPPPAIFCFGNRRAVRKLLSRIRSGSAVVNGCISRTDYRWCGGGAAGQNVYTSRDAFNVFSRLRPVGIHPRFLPEIDLAAWWKALIRKLSCR